MKRKLIWLIVAFTLALAVGAASAQTDAVNGYCAAGGTSAVTQGDRSTNKLQAIIPQCTVTVYNTGTLTLATIYRDKISTPLANPFRADQSAVTSPASSGQWIFYAASSTHYDIVLSGGIGSNTYPAPVTFVDVTAGGGGGGIFSITPGTNINCTPNSGGTCVGAVTINSSLPTTGNFLVLNGGVTNGVYEPYQCSTSNAPSWCSGPTACQYIASAITAMGSGGGIVDATQFSGVQACAVNPFGTATGNGVLLLGNATFQTTAAWVVPSPYSWRIIGTQRKAETSPQNTIIQAVTGFPVSTPVIRLGNGTPAYGQEISNLTVDCNSITGTTGIYSTDIQEESGVQHVTILNCPNRGLWMNGSGHDGTGPFYAENYSINDLYVLPLTAGTSSTIACEFDGLFTTFHKASAMTCGGGSSSPIADAFIFDSIYAGTADNLNAEDAFVGYLIGNTNPVTSFSINGMQSSNISTTVVSLKSTDSSVSLTGIVNGGNSATQTLLDPAHLSAPLTDFSIANYSFGTGNSYGVTPIYSTSPNVAAKFAGLSISNGLDAANYLVIDAGKTTSQSDGVQFADHSNIKWSVVMDTSDNFEIVDNADSFQTMYAPRLGVVDIRAQGANSVNFNDTPGSGTAGVDFWSGGATPVATAAITSSGVALVSGITLTAFTTGCLTNTAGVVSSTGAPCSAGVTSINGTPGAFTFSFSSGAGSCSGTTCSFTGSGSGGGSVTNFIASSGSWPSWLVPTVTNSTTTPTLAVAASAIPNSALATQTANTVLGALTATTPSGLALPSCSTTASALNYTSGTGFGCNTAIVASTAATWATARLLAGNSVNGSANVPFANAFIVQGTTDAGLTGAQFLGALSTGLLKNTATTGVLSIATAGTDYLTPTGSATGLSKASSSAFGVSECDNTTITCAGGVFTATNSGSGTVTHTVGALTALHLVIGNGAADVKVDTVAVTDGAGNETVASLTTNGTGVASQINLTPSGTSPATVAGAASLGVPNTVTTAGVYLLPAAPCTGFATFANASSIVSTTCTGSTGSGNVVLATSPTLVTPNIGAATGTSLLATGIVDGTAPVTVTTSSTATLGGTYNSGYTFNQEGTAATAITYTLPTAAAGKQYCVGNSYNGSAATTGTLEVITSASGQYIIFTDGTLSATGGYVLSGGAAADFACFVGVDATHWYFKPSSGSWTKH
jgi:hypothetical protein